MKKIALITGVTGQDGSYLAEFLLKKKYVVHGIKRKSSSFNTERIDHIFEDKNYKNRFFLHYGDLTDSDSIFKIINKVRPTEIYNLGAQSHVGVSFENPVYTSEVTALGCLRILEIIRFLKLKTKFYQATTSELFGEKELKITEWGTIKIDFDTLEDETVTVRDRDSMKQNRVKTGDLEDLLRNLLQ